MSANIVEVAVGIFTAAVLDDTVLDVDGCSDILSLSKRFLINSSGISDGERITSNEEGYRVIPAPNYDGALDGGSSTISSMEINLGGRCRSSGL